MHWLIYAAIVIFGASGMHIFSRMAKGVVHPFSTAFISALILAAISLGFLVSSSEARADIASLDLKMWLPAILMGLSVSATSIAILFVYSAGAPLSIAAPIIRVSGILIAVLVGLLFFSEQLTLVKSIGFVMALIGIVVMAL